MIANALRTFMCCVDWLLDPKDSELHSIVQIPTAIRRLDSTLVRHFHQLRGYLFGGNPAGIERGNFP